MVLRMSYSHLSDKELIERLSVLVERETRTTAEIVAVIQEIDRRKLYLEQGHTSLFGFLTKEMGYTEMAAQRRIDAARLSNEMPEIKKDLESGSLNLSQVAAFARCVRVKSKQDPEKKMGVETKRQILEQVKDKDFSTTMRIFAQNFDIKLEISEKVSVQKDGSFRLEFTLSESEMNLLGRAKEIQSHQNPNPKLNELIMSLARFYLKQKDPVVSNRTSASLVPPRQNQPQSRRTRYIPAPTRRAIFQRDQHCQWRDPSTGKLCGSRFQLQIDHRVPVHAGGRSDPINLQILCSVHNRRKFKLGN